MTRRRRLPVGFDTDIARARAMRVAAESAARRLEPDPRVVVTISQRPGRDGFAEQLQVTFTRKDPK